MATVVWTPRAYADLDAIGTYLALDAPRYVARILRALLKAADRLEVFPASGRVVPEMEDASFREIIYRNYRIIYLHSIVDDRVEILTVFHASQQFGGLPNDSGD